MFHVNNPETFQSIIQLLRSFIAIGQACRFSDLLADCTRAGEACQAASTWAAVCKSGVSFAHLVTRKINAWSITPVNEISQHQRSLEIHKKITRKVA